MKVEESRRCRYIYSNGGEKGRQDRNPPGVTIRSISCVTKQVLNIFRLGRAFDLVGPRVHDRT